MINITEINHKIASLKTLSCCIATMSSLMMCCLLLMFGLLSEGREILVGGKSNTWKVPESTTEETLNHWSERARFKIGDSLCK